MGSHPIPLFKHDTEAEKFSCPFVSLPGTSGLTTWAISWHTEYVPLPLFTHAQFGEKRMRSFSLSLPERFLSKKRESFQSLLDLLKYDWEQLPLGWTKTDWRIWSTNIWTIWSIICLKKYLRVISTVSCSQFYKHANWKEGKLLSRTRSWVGSGSMDGGKWESIAYWCQTHP